MKKHNKIGKLSSAGLLTLCSAIQPVHAAPPDLAVTLAAPAKGARGPSDVIRLQIPALTDAVIQQLALELDDLDISGMVSVEGKEIIFNPPQPLPWGTHQLRLVENMPDGNIREVGVWNLEIRKSALFREAGLQPSVTLSLSDRLADSSLSEPKPKSYTASGGGALSGMVADGDWRLSGQTNFITNTQRRLLPLGENGPYIDIGTFLLTLNKGPLVAQAGHHSPITDSLIVSGLQRRGVSVGVKSAENNMGLTLFGVRAQDITGAVHGLGIGEAENLISGISASIQPVGNEATSLALMATYISGKDPGIVGVGTGVGYTSSHSTQGSAGDILMDSQFLEKRVRVLGEYAQTQYDFDGKGVDTDLDGVIDSNLDPIKDTAHRVVVTYMPWHEKILGDSPIGWTMGMEKNRVGSYFKSIASPSSTADYSSVRAFTEVNWAGIALQASLGSGTDNVNDLSQIPRTRTTQRFTALSYVPPASQQASPDGKSPDIPWYGNPTYSLIYTGVSRSIEQGGGNILVGPVSDSNYYNLSARYVYSQWSWGVTLSTNDNTDQTHTSGSTKSNSIDLNASVMFANKLSLTPKWTYTLNKVRDVPAGITAADNANTLIGLIVSYPFTEKLTSSLSYTLNKLETPCGCQDTKSTDITGSMSWSAIPMAEAKYSLSMSLDGSYHHSENKVSTSILPSTYQIFLRMTMSWAPQL